jgi:hypothetical protein
MWMLSQVDTRKLLVFLDPSFSGARDHNFSDAANRPTERNGQQFYKMD